VPKYFAPGPTPASWCAHPPARAGGHVTQNQKPPSRTAPQYTL